MKEQQPAFKTYVAPSTILPELRPLPLLMGVVLGIIFGAASLYLALRIGMTVSASIPIAVMSISIFKWISKMTGMRQASILENNIVQTTGSAGESIAFGVAVTMPALLILGHDMDLTRIMVVAVLGGLLGILMMIPLRRGLIVKEHGKLAFPEGTACAEVLIAGEKGGTNAKTVFSGFGLGFIFKALSTDGSPRFFKSIPEKALSWFKGGSVSLDCSPELMGVGYIIGPQTAGLMVAGGVLAYLVLIPAIRIFGDGLTEPLFPATMLIKDMSPHQIRNAYVLYIGAGAVATAGIISMLRVLPTIAHAFSAGLKDLTSGQKGGEKTETLRTERDLPMWVVLVGSIGMVVALRLVHSMHLSLVGAVLVIVFGFLFVTVSSRLTGEIGSSSNPISGMTVATLLLTCLIYLAFKWTTPDDRVAALMVAAVVCIASSNGGTTAQDLKTGFLIGATPRSQQIGILVGALTSAIVIGVTLKVFNDSSTVYAKREFAYVVPTEKFEGRSKLGKIEAAHDAGEYNVVHYTDETTPRGADGKAIIPAGKYLVDDNGAVRYLVDPGINGVVNMRDPAPGQTEGTPVQKFDAPKARLMSLIIDGILTQKLPWGLVIIGAFIALTLELSFVSALTFAVGVYLPLSASTPIGLGGLVRYLVDRKSKGQSSAESDSSPGVLASSGLIAGGAIAGMVMAIFMGASSEATTQGVENFHKSLGWIAENDILPLVLFSGVAFLLYLVGRGKLLGGKAA